MGGAILSGLLDSGATTDGITVTNRTEAKAAALRSDRVTSLSSERDPDANRTAVRGARIVLVAVKPAMVADLLHELRDDFEPDAVIVSVAAGVTTATMEELVSHVVFRTMPNTPSIVRRGVTGLSVGSRGSADETALVRSLFETVGAVVEVPEDQLNALSTISGSGPAYVFFLIERLTETARHLGFDEAEARLMVEQTFLGASELLAASEVGPEELRRRVTSPNGTTERAIAEIAAADLTTVFDRATASAIQRAEEMAEGR
jgi:pyrroline-5-carboxylate reductase